MILSPNRSFCSVFGVGITVGILFSLLLAEQTLHAAEAPFIDAKAVKERWATVTAQDIADLRERHILVGSKSIGLNLVKGLGLLKREDAAFDLVTGFQRFDVEKKGGLPIIPPDIFQTSHFVHFLATRHPLIKRVEEVDQLIRQDPWRFGSQVDIAMIIYADVSPDIFPDYKRLMDALARDYPKTRFIHATTSIYAAGAKADSSGPRMHAFNELLRKEYRGKAPVLDMSAVLSDDFRDGLVMCAEYSKDPTGVHPNLALGMTVLAKGFVLAARDAMRWEGGAAPATAEVSPPEAAKTESLPADHPEYRAVRAILDRNGLKAMKVEGQTEVRDGHIVGLYLQEAGVEVIPDDIGQLVKLERLHCYGDRELEHPFLKSISPAIGKCVELQELLLNHNDLTTLPSEIAKLERIKILSLADNRLRELPEPAAAWARKHDSKGLSQQKAD